MSTRHAGIPDVVIENKTGLLVDENNIEEMASNMLKLVENRDLAEIMGQKGKIRIKNYFSLDKHLETINNLIYAIG